MGIAVKGADEFRSETEESYHFRANSRLDRPFGPILDINFEFEMHEPISQRCGHSGQGFAGSTDNLAGAQG